MMVSTRSTGVCLLSLVVLAGFVAGGCDGTAYVDIQQPTDGKGFTGDPGYRVGVRMEARADGGWPPPAYSAGTVYLESVEVDTWEENVGSMPFWLDFDVYLPEYGHYLIEAISDNGKTDEVNVCLCWGDETTAVSITEPSNGATFVGDDFHVITVKLSALCNAAADGYCTSGTLRRVSGLGVSERQWMQHRDVGSNPLIENIEVRISLREGENVIEAISDNGPSDSITVYLTVPD
jgi:hypothetical protein